MPSATKTFAFLSDSETLSEQGNDSVLNGLWSPTDGNPAGCIEFTCVTGGAATRTERMRGMLLPWYYWLPVPGVSRVMSLQVTSWDELRFGSVNVTSRTWNFRFVTTGGVTVHSAGDLISQTDTGAAIASDGGTPHANGAGTLRNVDQNYRDARTPVAFEIEHVFTSSANPTLDYEVDNIIVLVNYINGFGVPGLAIFPKFPMRQS